MRTERAKALEGQATLDIPTSTEAFFRDYLKLDKPDPDDAEKVVLTLAQWVLVRVIFDGVDPIDLETEEERELAATMFGPCERIAPEARHTVAMLKGARVGGTWLWSLYLLHQALVANLSRLAPGEVGFAPIVAERMELGYQSINYIKGGLRTAGLDHLRTNDAVESVDLLRPDGHRVTIKSFAAAKGGSATRGRSYFAALLDEACFFRSLAGGVVNDVEIWRSIAARVMAGGLVGLVSTAWAQEGLLWDLVNKNLGAPGGELHGRQETALACITPTELLRNDEKIKSDIRIARESDPENAAREFDCIPLTGETSAFFSGASITRAVKLAEDNGVQLGMPPGEGVVVGVGVDTGLVNDSSAAVIVHRIDFRHFDTVTTRYVVADAEEHKSPNVLSEVCSSYAALMIAHGKRTALSDQHEIEASQEHLAKDRCSLEQAPAGQAGKLLTYSFVRDRLEADELWIHPSLESLISQLRDVMSKPVPGGGMKIWSPRKRGSHGDIASALVNAVWDAKQSGLAPLVPPRRPKTASRWGRRTSQRGY